MNWVREWIFTFFSALCFFSAGFSQTDKILIEIPQTTLERDFGTEPIQITIPVKVSKKPAPTPPPPTTVDYFSITDYGAKPNDGLDDLAAFRSALAAAKASTTKRKVFVPAGVWIHSSPFDVDSVELFGVGDSSQIVASSPLNSAIYLKGLQPKIAWLSHVVNTTGLLRQTSGPQSNLAIWQATGATIDNVLADGATCFGILSYGSTGVLIQYTRVRRTFADGIHFNAGSSNSSVFRCNVREAADDSIAVVSSATSPQQTGISIIENDVGYSSSNGRTDGNRWGRGITVVGGDGVTIIKNKIAFTAHAGLYFAAESNFNTRNTTNVTASDNTLTDCGDILNPQHYHGGIMFFTQDAKLVSNITCERNIITRPKYDGVRVPTGTNVSGIRLIGNTITGLRTGFKAYSISTTAAPSVTIQ